MSHFEYESFAEIPLHDPFFNSLREDYPKFDHWFNRKAVAGDNAYVLYDDDEKVIAFLYIKIEEDDDISITPLLPSGIKLKVGTLKINAHGTRLGERVIKKIMDNATERGINTIYLTIYEKHTHLISLLQKYGFFNWGKKADELVLVKRINNFCGDMFYDYPVIGASGKKYWGLGIYPEYHTRLFADSILKNESYDLLSDIAPTNTISKIYLSAMGCINEMSKGDIVLMYRTSDNMGPARYRSVITSVCVVEEITNINDYTQSEFLDYCRKGSIFTDAELTRFFATKKYPHIIKMTYNIALNKKVTNEKLTDDVGLTPDYWGCFTVSENQLKRILELGHANMDLIRFDL